MKFRAEFSFASVAVVRSLSVGDATEARFTAWEPVPKKPVARSKGARAGDIRQRRAAAPCTPIEIAVIEPECNA